MTTAFSLAATAGLLVLAACARSSDGAAGDTEPRARAQLIDGAGRTIGTAHLAPAGNDVAVTVEAEELPPGPHGLHIHETGVCTPPDFTSAGGHWNPTGKEHGLRNPQGPHAGDLPNLTVRADGTVDTTIVVDQPELSLASGPILGGAPRALVIHAGGDDMMTDPSGDSGDRIACGVLEPT